jgi:hypothetical protein
MSRLFDPLLSVRHSLTVAILCGLVGCSGGGDSSGNAGAGGVPGIGGSGAAGEPGLGGSGATTSAAGAGAGGGSPGSGGQTGGPEQVAAFPGAEGFGKDSLGGRGGRVCHVTHLGDSGAGSLRDCVFYSNTTVVFDVGGWITLANDLGIVANNITIAGQTAPGSGIGIRGRKFSIGGDHTIVRYLRMRRGILVTTDRDDAMTVSSAAENVIIDHCSIGYGTDENFSMPGDEGVGPRNLTVQWSIIAWGLQRNNHSAGSLLTSNQLTIHHTLWAFNKTRNPRGRSEDPATRGQGGHLDWVNNVIYGWNAPDPVGEAAGWSISSDPFILAGTSNGTHWANAVGNYFVATQSANYAFHNGTPNFNLYFEDNLLDGNANGALDSSKSDLSMVEGTPTMLTARIDGALVTTESPANAYNSVLADVGVSFPMRDEADALLIDQVRNQTGILIQSEQDLIALGVGDNGYGSLPETTRPARFDTDRDGMPDSWESNHGFDPATPDDSGDADGDGYTNLEEYLNALVE